MNEAQKFLLDNECGDLVINGNHVSNPEKWIYVSDIMEKYKEQIQQTKFSGGVDFAKDEVKRIKSEERERIKKIIENKLKYAKEYGLTRKEKILEELLKEI